MSARQHRGRPRKSAFFKSGARRSQKRPVTLLGQALKQGQQEFAAQLRIEFGAGPNVPIAAILDVMRHEDEPKGSPWRLNAERELDRVRSCNGGAARALLNADRRRAIMLDHSDLFEQVKSGRHTANRAAELLRIRLQQEGGDGWRPSIRTLNKWFAVVVDGNSEG